MRVLIIVALILPLLPVFRLPINELEAVLEAQETPVGSVSWMSGCWVASSGDRHWQEVWMEPRGGLMMGMAREVRGDVVAVYEFLRLHVEDGSLVYSAHPSGQQPADFNTSRVSGDMVRFENPDHDFPQKLEYHKTTPDSLLARVFAGTADVSPAFEIPFGREPCGAGDAHR